VVGWGSTLGAIEEAVDRLRAEGFGVSSVHLRFLSPLEPGLPEIFARFRSVLTVGINYSDPVGAPLINAETRRPSALAVVLRAQLALEIDSWSNCHGQPLSPGAIYAELRQRLTRSQKGDMACSV
jgi:2-oxoglutarate ferredoxin oxidoreductase subunit alpha